MGLSLYFYSDKGEELDSVGITHNLNKMICELDVLCRTNYYECVWRPEEIFDTKDILLYDTFTEEYYVNTCVSVKDILPKLGTLYRDLVLNKKLIEQHLPSNGWGTFEGMLDFINRYIKICIKYPDSYVHAWR